MGGKHRFYFFPSRIVLLTITSSIKLNLKNELILFSFHRISGKYCCSNKREITQSDFVKEKLSKAITAWLFSGEERMFNF